MIIQINTYGVHISTYNFGFCFKNGEEVRKISIAKVTAIHVHKACTVTTPALELAAENKIPFLILDDCGKVTAKIWEPVFGSTVAIRRAQLKLMHTTFSYKTMCGWLLLKGEGQNKLLQFLAERIKAQAEDIKSKVSDIDVVLEAHKQKKPSAINLRVMDAQMSKLYFEGLRIAMKNYLPFEKRSRNPAEDYFNALLNYGYGMLYTLVETAMHSAGLDPHISIHHREEYNTPAFVFDAIEPFRPWVDTWVCELAMSKNLKSSHFKTKSDGYQLSTEGKNYCIPIFFDYLETSNYFNGKRMKRKDHIQFFLSSFAQKLIDK